MAGTHTQRDAVAGPGNMSHSAVRGWVPGQMAAVGGHGVVVAAGPGWMVRRGW